MLKTKTITTDKATVLVVELPEGAKPHNSYCDAILYTLPNGYVETEYPVESDGSWGWQLIGRISDITEEQADKVVEYKNITSDYQCDCCGYDIDCYRNYLEQSEKDWSENPVADRLSDSTTSLSSLLQANEVYFENRVPHPSEIFTIEYDETNFFHRLANKKWKDFQSKVFDKERCYLFIKVD